MTVIRSIRASVLLVAALAAMPPAFAQQGERPAEKPAAEAEHKQAKTVDMAALHKPGALTENVLGKADAPVTVVEYASLTCPHCASFHAKGFEALRTGYIDTGKVRFIFRDFPFDNLALGATMLSRCAEPAKFFEITSGLMKTQEKWAFGKDPEAELRAFFATHGLDGDKFDACLQNKEIYDGVLANRKRGYEDFDVDSTPTLFINGVRHTGALSPEQLEAALKPLLADKK